MNKLMIDIETLSRKPDGCVISIGAAVFNDHEVLSSEGWAIDPKHWHGHIDPDTVQWWIKQSNEAREYSFSGTNVDMSVALGLRTIVMDNELDEIWANDPSFDLVILEQWWGRVGYHQWPFKFWQYRAYRTVTALTQEFTGLDPKSFKGTFVAHNPVEDAVAQARAVIQCRRALSERSK